MPKMSQICEELKALEGHKHTYLKSFIYIDSQSQVKMSLNSENVLKHFNQAVGAQPNSEG